MKNIGLFVTVLCTVAIAVTGTSLLFSAYQPSQKINTNSICLGNIQKQLLLNKTITGQATSTITTASTTEQLRGAITEKYVLEANDLGNAYNSIIAFNVEKTPQSKIKCPSGPTLDENADKNGLVDCTYDNYTITQASTQKKYKISDLDLMSKDDLADCSINIIAADKDNIYADESCGSIGGWTTGTLIKYNPENKTKENYITNTFGFYRSPENFLLIKTQDLSDDNNGALSSGKTNFVLVDLQKQTKTSYNTGWTCEENSSNIHFDCSELVFSGSNPDSFYIMPMLYDNLESKIYKLTAGAANEATELTKKDIEGSSFWFSIPR